MLKLKFLLAQCAKSAYGRSFFLLACFYFISSLAFADNTPKQVIWKITAMPTQGNNVIVFYNMETKVSYTVSMFNMHIDLYLVECLDFQLPPDSLNISRGFRLQILNNGAAWLFDTGRRATEEEVNAMLYASQNKLGIFKPGYLDKNGGDRSKKYLNAFVERNKLETVPETGDVYANKSEVSRSNLAAFIASKDEEDGYDYDDADFSAWARHKKYDEYKQQELDSAQALNTKYQQAEYAREHIAEQIKMKAKQDSIANANHISTIPDDSLIAQIWAWVDNLKNNRVSFVSTLVAVAMFIMAIITVLIKRIKKSIKRRKKAKRKTPSPSDTRYSYKFG